MLSRAPTVTRLPWVTTWPELLECRVWAMPRVLAALWCLPLIVITPVVVDEYMEGAGEISVGGHQY